MPIYEARCRDCGIKYSYMSKWQDRDVCGTCSNCSSNNTTPVLSATPTSFKFADVRARKGRR